MPTKKYISRISKGGYTILIKDSEARSALNSMEMDADSGEVYFEYDDGNEEKEEEETE